MKDGDAIRHRLPSFWSQGGRPPRRGLRDGGCEPG
jgi:hypothetical protein